VITVFVVPAAYLLVHRKEETQRPPDGQDIVVAGKES